MGFFKEFVSNLLPTKEYPDNSLTVQGMNDGTADISDTNLDGLVSMEHSSLLYGMAELPENEKNSIIKYREMANTAEVDEAVSEIINETFTIDGELPAIKIDFKQDSKFSQEFQNKINTVFDYVYNDLFAFNTTGRMLYRSWYIDSRLFLHKVISKEKNTIVKLQQIDPLYIRRLKNTKRTDECMIDLSKEDVFYTYIPKSLCKNGVNLDKFWNAAGQLEKTVLFKRESIAYTDSGLLDANNGYVISYLHKSIIPYNNMKMMEDAMVIYRVVRAPERRIFYIDVSNLTRTKGEEHLKDQMNRYKNKMVYDKETGVVADRRNVMSMLEDIWLPRKSNGRSTEVSTLQGAQNLGVIEDVEYCRERFYRSLNVPKSRFNQEQNSFHAGRITEITRDEYRFLKFIQHMRSRFITVVEDVLKTELQLRKIIKTDQDWKDLKRDIIWIYSEDNNFVELKQNEILNNKIDTLTNVNPFLGSLFSRDWALKNIMKMTEAEINEQQEQIKKEKSIFGDEEDGWNGGGKSNGDSERQHSFSTKTSNEDSEEEREIERESEKTTERRSSTTNDGQTTTTINRESSSGQQ